MSEWLLIGMTPSGLPTKLQFTRLQPMELSQSLHYQAYHLECVSIHRDVFTFPLEIKFINTTQTMLQLAFLLVLEILAHSMEMVFLIHSQRQRILACDSADNIYVWDYGNALIRRINQNRDVVTITRIQFWKF